MVHGLRDLRRGYLWALEGDVGRITDVYFDEVRWEIRYLVVETGWASGRRVLVSRAEAADVAAADPQSREILRADPALIGSTSLLASSLATTQDDADGHLRSARDIVGYKVDGIDGPL